MKIDENIKEKASSFEGLDNRGISARLNLLDNAVKELEQDNEKLRSSIRERDKLLNELEGEHPGITERRLTEDGAIIID